MAKVFLNEKLIFENVKVAKSFWDKLFGIMFLKHVQNFDAVIFKDVFWIHSFFCFLKFKAIYLDKNFRILKIENNIKANRIMKPVFGAYFVIEYFKDVDFSVFDEVRVEF